MAEFNAIMDDVITEMTPDQSNVVDCLIEDLKANGYTEEKQRAKAVYRSKSLVPKLYVLASKQGTFRATVEAVQDAQDTE